MSEQNLLRMRLQYVERSIQILNDKMAKLQPAIEKLEAEDLEAETYRAAAEDLHSKVERLENEKT